MINDFKFLLNRAVRRSGASSFVEKRTVISHFKDFLSEHFGKNFKEAFKILNFDDGEINVACLCELSAENLRLKEKILIDKINEKLDKSLVTKINVLT